MAHNIISDGISWISTERTAHVSESVTLTTAATTVTIDATVIEPEATVNPQGLRVKTDKYVFLVKAGDVNGLRLIRGVQFRRPAMDPGFYYEVIIDGTLQDFNDPDNVDLAIDAQRRVGA